MATHQPYSVALTYLEDQQMLSVRAIEPAKIAPLLTGKLELPILLDEFDFKLDDEFARRLGVAVLNLIALGQPDIKKYISATQATINKPTQR
ncbi:hypothetical protein AWB70_05971 [Caballeronia cordobensis]|uniref:Uncharacterized protein n=1 Tax=Caballeronia cordobensis TaxID=1353886 RepID=A0A158J6A4_CABCO|nr:hypothetical protein [Caballeronia cordobensis]SAL64368.1 hypothetical protein AWB70_05971 [Caballeronia cordobensis]